MLRSLRDADQPLEKQTLGVPMLTVKARFGVQQAIVIAGAGFSTAGMQIVIPGIGILTSFSPISWRGVGFKKKFVCLAEKPAGWVAYIGLVKPPPKRKATQKGKRLHNEAAIFMADKVKPQTVSGGLPSLGKRK